MSRVSSAAGMRSISVDPCTALASRSDESAVTKTLLRRKSVKRYNAKMKDDEPVIAAGVSNNLYAYSRYGQLTNETVQNLCASAPLRETLSRASDTLGRSAGFSLSPLPLGEGQGEGAAPYSVTYTYDNYGRFQSQTS
jgi:hypothetical protein